jgi:2-polyprenyl-3-methyl-5-hydroxy-6-metoxy-1,4-benzoquinol methylase
MKTNINFYNEHAADLFEQYESASFEQVHEDWLHLFPTTGSVLDIGAGSGRDSAYMASKGLKVFAVEPASSLRALAATNHTAPNIIWLDDALPKLSHPAILNTNYDLILLSAVWMHLSASEREICIHQLCSLLGPNANLIITLRHGEAGDQRIMHPVSYSEIESLLASTKFICTLLNKSGNKTDLLGRKNVSWQTVQVFRSDTN